MMAAHNPMHGLAPDSRRRRFRRIAPVLFTALLLLAVLASFVFVPAADGAPADEVARTIETPTPGSVSASVSVTQGLIISFPVV
ncbi:MAG: hypothetical protein M0R75_02525 [Dehalococcoidia bacterium]|nr:hypothetical protein [Dehalococcoidia bacterium]